MRKSIRNLFGLREKRAIKRPHVGGIKPSIHDSRDLYYRVGEYTNANTFTLKEYRGPILDQQQYNACSGFGTAGMLNSYFKRLTDLDYTFSPWWIWHYARKLRNAEIKNDGVYVRDIFKTILKEGVIERYSWEPKNKILDAPTYVPEWQRIFFKKFERLHVDTLENLNKNFTTYICQEELPIGVMIAIQDKAIVEASYDGELLFEPNDTIVGYHWLYCDGYNQNGITLVNSWGKDWGYNGTCFVPWEDASELIVEAWTLDAHLL